MIKKVLVVTKGICWFAMSWFAGRGIGALIREEGINKKSLPKTILGTITATGIVAIIGWAGSLVYEELYDEFFEEDEEGRSR